MSNSFLNKSQYNESSAKDNVAIHDSSFMGDKTVKLENEDAFAEKIKALNAEIERLKKQNKGQTEKIVIENASEPDVVDETLSPELLSLAKQRLQELKQTQPYELTGIFFEDPTEPEAVPLYEPHYHKHLAEEKDSSWSYQAEEFLKNYFARNSQTFRPIRIDCRTSTCEVAGMSILPADLIKRNQEAKQNSDKKEFINTQMELMNIQSGIDRDLIFEVDFKKYFKHGYVYSSYTPEYTDTILPYAFMVRRAN